MARELGPASRHEEIALPLGSYFPDSPREETRNWEATKYVFYVVFKWKRLIIGLFLAFTAAASVAMYTKAPVRVAVAKLLIQADRTAMQISGLSSPSGRRGELSNQALQSEIEAIESRDVVYPVAMTLLRQAGVNESPTIDQIDNKVAQLRANSQPTVLPETNVVQVLYTATTSEEALKNLKLLIEQYLRHRSETHSGSTKLLEFYQQEKDRSRAELHTNEEVMRKWQSTNNIVAMEGQIDSQLRQLTQLQTDLNDSVSGESVFSMNRDRAPLVAKLRDEVQDAEFKLSELGLRYTSEDRRVQEQVQKLAILKRQLGEAQRFVSGAVATQRGVLEQRIRETQAALATLREKKVQYDELARTVQLTKDQYALYGKSLEEARIAARLDQEQLSNVTVLEKAHESNKTDLDRRIAVILLASIVGLSIGVAGAFLLEMLNYSIRTHDDVEEYLRLPVLAVIPDLRGAL